MTLTLTSGSGLLCPVSEFLKRIDPNTVAALCSDDRANPVTADTLTTDPHCLAALGDASGLIESTAAQAGKYGSADLQALANASPPTLSTYLLWRMVSDIAWVFLWERRPNKNVPSPPSLQRTQEMLAQLQQGHLIFAFQEVEQAGIPEIHQVTPEEVRERNLATVQAARLFGRRADRTYPYYP